MPDVLTHPPGSVCWLDLGTTDAAGAEAFYASLFGWRVTDRGTDDMPYTRFAGRDGDACGAYTLTPEQTAGGVPPHWLPYFAVEDARAAAAHAERLGGAVVGEPFDVTLPGDVLLGRGAVLTDPEGAFFAVWEGHAHPGFGIDPAEVGSVAWAELGVRDAAAATAFYTALLGCTAEAGPVAGMEYTMLSKGDRMIGGVYAMDESYGDAPAHWMTYFTVEDTDAVADAARSAGGHVCVPPTDIPTIGRFAVIDDPQGATFSVLQPVRA